MGGGRLWVVGGFGLVALGVVLVRVCIRYCVAVIGW